MQGTGDEQRSCIELLSDGRFVVALCVFPAVQGEEVAEETSWWKDAVTEEFSRQDVVVLALIAICVLRLMVFVVQVMWKLVRLPMQWYAALEKEDVEVETMTGKDSEDHTQTRKQLAVIRFCHLQFLLVVEKLKREMREAKNEDTQHMVASLKVPRHEEGRQATLQEIFETLQKIQAQDSSFETSEVEGHLADIKQDPDEEDDDADADLPEAWSRLQEIYASFLRIQATIIRRQQRKRTSQWQHEQQQGSRRRQHRLPSSEDPTSEVLQELQQLTKELPQGFTADMFTSLGNAMHEDMVAAEPETSPAPSPQLEMKPPRSASSTSTSVVCAEANFSDGAEDKPQVAIEARDIKGSELEPWPDGDVHVVAWETADEPLAAAKQEKKPAPVPVPEEEDEDFLDLEDFAVQAAIAKAKNDAKLKRYASYRTAVWWWSHEKTELTTQEQAAVLAVVVTMLTVAGLGVALLWNLGWFAWRFYRERRTLNRLFSENDPAVLEQELRKFPVDLLSLRIKQIASVRLRHLQVVTNARDFKQQLEAIEFRQAETELVNMPLHPINLKEMTFPDIQTAAEEITCRGEQVAVEIMQLVVPPRWKNYIDADAWLKVQDESLQTLHLENARVQQISEQIKELVVAIVNSDGAISKQLFQVLLDSLRQSSATPPQNGTNGTATPSELDAYTRCWSGSMTMSGSVGNLGGNRNKDDFNFLLKAFDEVVEKQKVRQELQSAIENFQSAHEPEHEQLLLLENTDSVSNSQIIQRTKAAASSGETAASMRRLERLVDAAEVLEMTYIEEVESAQFMLEDVRRDNFCAAIVSNESKGLDSVQALANNFVMLGAKHQDAVLKAGEILANRSNMMLLVTSLRGMFDQLRKRDIMKMNERRNRDRAKAQDKRDRMAQKFQNKQQLMIEKMERTREAQRQMEEEARLQRRMEELKAWRAQNARDRSSFVWTVTKADVLVVLVIMAIVFFENLREVAFIKPLCQPDDEHHWWMVSWWAPSSLQVFGCEVAYGIKILAILVALGVLFFAVAQLNLVAVMLPVMGGIALYYVRDEWMNMLFRLPLLLVIYGFNSGILFLLNRFENRSDDALVTKGGDKDLIVKATKERSILLYVAFPLFSLLLTVVTGVGIACDAPEQCVASAYATTTPVLAGLWQLVRGAYRL
ncbi:unnamed protein product [Phytophthora lilii]|uniref:Unnamed protein product n=1 Tax=Phytophthora lilii TaxID=2077276 RepID=A0A9W6TXZ2_9STRA|nr:unnamed protein product [Phytophthora lilii]